MLCQTKSNNHGSQWPTTGDNNQQWWLPKWWTFVGTIHWVVLQLADKDPSLVHHSCISQKWLAKIQWMNHEVNMTLPTDENLQWLVMFGQPCVSRLRAPHIPGFYFCYTEPWFSQGLSTGPGRERLSVQKWQLSELILFGDCWEPEAATSGWYASEHQPWDEQQ